MFRWTLLSLLFLALFLGVKMQAQEKVVTVEVLPKQVKLQPGEEYRFIARGYNGYYEEVRFAPQWSASGGTIDQEGVYRANLSEGVFFVNAMDRFTKAQGSAVVTIKTKTSEIEDVPIPSPVSVITRLAIIPDTVEISPGETRRFQVSAYNNLNQQVYIPFPILWKADGGTMTNDGLYRAGGVPGTYFVQASNPGETFKATATVKIQGWTGNVVSLKIWPAEAILKPYEKKRFFATAYDMAGNVVPVNTTWEATGGTIDENNIYTAFTSAGTYFVKATTPGGISSTARIIIESMKLERVEIIPSQAVLDPFQIVQFQLKTYDREGREMPAYPNWSATGGTIQKDGTYQAGQFPGKYSIWASTGKFTATATVSIKPYANKPVRITITPTDAVLEPGQKKLFSAVVYNKADQPVSTKVQWLARGGGMIDPSGVYEAGPVPGKYVLEAFFDDELSTKVWVTIKPAYVPVVVAWLHITPKHIELGPGEKVNFKVRALDAMGKEIPCALKWSAEEGSIADDGLHTAALNPGTYLIQATPESNPNVKAVATVVVGLKDEKPQGQMVITPRSVKLRSGERCPFDAELRNHHGKVIPSRIQWKATGGNIDETGRYEAGNRPGTYKVTATDTQTGISNYAEVVIEEKKDKNDTEETVYITKWKTGYGGEIWGELEIQGRVFAPSADRLKLIVENQDGSMEVLSELRIRKPGQQFEFTGKYVRSTTRAIKIVLYDMDDVKIYEFKRNV